MKIRLTGYIDVPASRLDEVRAALPEHIRLTRAETGCISFNVTASSEQKGRLLVEELFADRAAYNRHQARTKASDWATVTAGIPRHYVIEETV